MSETIVGHTVNRVTIKKVGSKSIYGALGFLFLLVFILVHLFYRLFCKEAAGLQVPLCYV